MTQLQDITDSAKLMDSVADAKLGSPTALQTTSFNTGAPSRSLLEGAAGLAGVTADLAGDIVTNPHGAATAVVTDAALSMYNLGAMLVGAEEADTEEVLSLMSEAGFSAPEEFFAEHDVFTRVASLVVGGGAIAVKATAGIMRYASALGKIKVTDSSSKIARIINADRDALIVLQAANAGQESLAQARRVLKFKAGGAAILEGIVFESTFAAATARHPYMEDYNASDWLLNAGIMGGLGLAFRALPEFKVINHLTDELDNARNKLVADHLNFIPAEYRHTMEGASISLIRAKKLEELLPTFETQLERSAVQQSIDIMRADAVKLLNKNLLPEGLKIEVDVARVSGVVTAPRTLAGELTKALVDPKEAQKLYGVKVILSYDSKAHAPFIDFNSPKNLIDDEISGHLAFFEAKGINKGTQEAMLKDTRTALNDSAKRFAKPFSIEKTAKGLAKKYRTAISTEQLKGFVKSVEETETVSYLDIKTGRILDKITAAKNGTSVDHNIQGLSILPVAEQTNAQVHASLRHSAEVGQRKAIPAVKGEFDNMSVLDRTVVVEHSVAFDKQAHQTYNGVQLKGKDDIMQAHIAKTVAEIQAAILNRTHSYSEIAIRHNVKPESVIAIDNKLFNADEAFVNPESFFNSLGKASWVKEAEPTLFRLEGRLRNRNYDAESKSVLDMQAARDMNAEFQAHLLDQYSGAELVQSIVDISKQDVVKTALEQLRSVSQSHVGSRSINTADQALRDEAVGTAANYTGSQFRHVRQNYIAKAIRPLAEDAEKIGADDFLRVELTKSINALRSAKPQTGQVVGFTAEGELAVLKIGKKAGEFETVSILLDNVQPRIRTFWENYMRGVGKDLYAAQNFNREMHGMPKLGDKGIRLPATLFNEKNRAYIVFKDLSKPTEVLSANTGAGLESLIKIANDTNKGSYRVITTDQAEDFNIWSGHARLEEMSASNIGKETTSAIQNVIPLDSSLIDEFLIGVAKRAELTSRDTLRATNSEFLLTLQRQDKIATSTLKGQPTDEAAQKIGTVWKDIENSFFDQSGLTSRPALDNINTAVTSWVNSLARVSRVSVASLGNESFWYTSKIHKMAERVNAKYKEAGIEAPHANLIKAVAETEAYRLDPKAAESAVSALTFFSAYGALRFLEAAQATVNAISIPITTIPEVMIALKASGNEKFGITKIMMEGVRRAWSTQAKDVAIMKRLESRGILESNVSEVNDAMRSITLQPSAVKFIEGNKVLGNWVTKPADASEAIGRRIAAGIGSVIAEIKFGKNVEASLHDAHVDEWVKRTIGNFNTNQRPIMFQGTTGSAIGLFQTYVFMLGQNTYRMLEAKQHLPLAAMMGTQSTLFGLDSLPGFQLFNQYLSTHFDNTANANLNTFVYEQFGDIGSVGQQDRSLAETILYGVPATLADISLYTRGILSPRSPAFVNSKGGFGFNLPIAAPVVTAIQTTYNAYEGVAAGMDTIPAIGQALQLQHFMRPVAGIADIVAGRSIDKKGATISPDVGFNSDPSKAFGLSLAMFARAIGSRPLREQVVKDLNFFNTHFDSIDRENRKPISRLMRKHAAEGTLTSEVMFDAKRKYMGYGGTENGFNSAMNNAMLETDGIKAEQFLKPMSDLNLYQTDQ